MAKSQFNRTGTSLSAHLGMNFGDFFEGDRFGAQCELLGVT